jgi:hypothetical protein
MNAGLRTCLGVHPKPLPAKSFNLAAGIFSSPTLKTYLICVSFLNAFFVLVTSTPSFIIEYEIVKRPAATLKIKSLLH